MRLLHRNWLLIGVLLTANSLVYAAQAPTVLEAEVADVAELPPLNDHNLILSGGGEGARILDGDNLRQVAQLYSAPHSHFAVDPQSRYFYVAETYWSRGNRGQRQDLLTVYQGDTLSRVAEINLPGRLYSDPKSAGFDISSDGHFGYVYNFDPASSVIVVDLQKRKVAGTVSIAGCGLVYAWGPRGFASLCADGTMATVVGTGPVARSAVFFDAGKDPVFDESIFDRRGNKAFLLTYTGKLYAVDLGEKPQIAAPWSIQQAAGLSPATANAGQVTWRPGGVRLAAYHRGSGRLFVLMHEGVHWSHAEPGTEVWVLDTVHQKVESRFTLPQSANSIAVTQDAHPVLFALSEEWLWALDARTGDVLHARHGVRGELMSGKDF